MAGTFAIVLCIGLSGCAWISRTTARGVAEKSMAFTVNSLAQKMATDVELERIGLPLSAEDFPGFRVNFLVNGERPEGSNIPLGGTPNVFESLGSDGSSRLTFWVYQGASVTTGFTSSAELLGCGSLTLAADRSVTLADSECPGWVTARFPSSTVRVVSLEEVLTKQKGRTTW